MENQKFDYKYILDTSKLTVEEAVDVSMRNDRYKVWNRNNKEVPAQYINARRGEELF